MKKLKGSSIERLTTLNERLEKFPEPIQKSADQMRGTFANLVNYMQGIVGDLQREIKDQNAKYEKQLAGVKDLNESVKNLLTQLDENSKNQKNAVNTLSTNVGELTTDIQSLDAAIKSFTSDSSVMSQSIGAIKGHVETLGNASRELVQKADVTPLNANIKGMNRIIGEISQNSQTLADAVDRLARQIDLSRTSDRRNVHFPHFSENSIHFPEGKQMEDNTLDFNFWPLLFRLNADACLDISDCRVCCDCRIFHRNR